MTGETKRPLLRMGVPVATPIGVSDWVAAASALLRIEPNRNAFETDIKELLGTKFVRSVNSGRSALYLSLEAMKRLSSRREVVIPAFACPSVGRAVVNAGLKVVVCDVGPSGSGLDLHYLEQVLSRNTLVVVAAHLYGYPVEIEALVERSHSAGAMVIEDCAQAFGAKLQDRYAGTLADAGIFSFGMSKVLWSMGGGVVATANPELDEIIHQLASTVKEPSWFGEAIDVAKFAALSMLLRSHHLGPLDAIWGEFMRGKGECDDFEVSVCPASHVGAARHLLARIAQITYARKQNAAYFSTGLNGYPGIVLPQVTLNSQPVFLRFPVVVRDKELKARIISGLRSKGINPSEMYRRDSYDAIRGFAERSSPCPQTEYLVERMLNLPTHAFMSGRELAETVATFDSVLGSRRTGSGVMEKTTAVTVN